MIYHEMRSPDLAQVNRESTVVVLPVAAVEQHGPHMPTGTDTILVTAIAKALEQRRPQQVLLLPTYWLGASSHHLRFGATLDARLGTLIAALKDICVSLLNDGYQRILLLNGHGGNVDPLKVALRELQPGYPRALLAGGSYWSGINDLINSTLEGEHRFVGHACEFETSLMMHLQPQLVDTSSLNAAGELVTDNIEGMFISRDMRQRTNSGFTGRPDLASAAKGEALFEGIVSKLEKLTIKMQDQILGETYRDFSG